ncbi:MAG: hypothetical protein Q4Q06_05985 [Bacteroidota bacterium]|nr:hypothetical protein [Bacteroidota bacterium]
MKKILVIVVSVFLVLGCRYKEDEQKIGSTIERFYHLLNNKEFNDMNKVCSPNMDNDIKLWKKVRKEMVRYSSIKILSIETEGEKAWANVSTTDEFGNEAIFLWNLVKIKNEWCLDNYSFIKPNIIERKTINTPASTLNSIAVESQTNTTQESQTETQTTK